MRKRAAQGGSGNVSLTPLRTPFGQLVYAVMRKCFWQRWHSDSGCKAALTRLGIPPSRREVAHSSRGAWRMGRHPVMQEALSNNTLKKYGLITPSDLASRDKPRVVSNRRMRKTARPVVWEP